MLGLGCLAAIYIGRSISQSSPVSVLNNVDMRWLSNYYKASLDWGGRGPLNQVKSWRVNSVSHSLQLWCCCCCCWGHRKVAKGLYGLQSFPATGFRSGLWVPRMPPWLAIWLVLISHVGCRQGTYFKAESIIWQRRKFTASQMSSLALINLFINSIIIY